MDASVTDEDARRREARETLERVSREPASLLGSALGAAGRRLGDHLAGRDAVGAAEGGRTDPIELWGRRIGRSLSVVFALALTWWLGAQLGWW